MGRQEPVYVGIPLEIRTRGGIALQKFIGDNIGAGQSFSFETTLRDLTFEQARRAKANGFLVEMIFVAAGPVEEHIKRVKIRADAGGHSASEGSLREIYERGRRFLITAFEENRKGIIDILAVFHNPPASPEAGEMPQASLIVRRERGHLAGSKGTPPHWFQTAVRGTDSEIEKLRGLTSGPQS